MSAPGTRLLGQCLASPGISRRRSLRTGSPAAHEIAQDADLRTIAPRGFFTLDGEPIRTTPGDGAEGNRIVVCPCPAFCSAGNGRTNDSGSGPREGFPLWRRGFRNEGYYASLSAIAVAVTGHAGMGLAFFGLTRSACGKPRSSSMRKGDQEGKLPETSRSLACVARSTHA
jgi:hypothetical protein